MEKGVKAMDRIFRVTLGQALLAAASTVAIGAAAPAMAAQAPIQINLNNIGGVEPGTFAYVGFNAAARYWESVLTTSAPVTINIDVGFDHLPPDVLGSTGSSFTTAPVQFVEQRLINSQFGAFDAQAVANLPKLTPGQYGLGALKMYTPGYTGIDADGNPYGIDNSTRQYDTDGSYNNTVIGLTTANAKALGYTLPEGTVDASITFSSDFAFDFDARDGITPGKIDFLAVAIHEIGHALGFVSGVDDYDVLGTGGPLADFACFSDGTLCKDYPANDDWFGETLDLFRYSGKNALDWTTGTRSYFSVDRGASAVGGNAYFSTGSFNGDGWQASHWKAPTVDIDGVTYFSCLRPKLGVMNPYICNGQNGIVTGLDLAALDAIGWNLNNTGGLDYASSTAQIASRFGAVPEPASWAMMIGGLALIGGAMRRRSVKVSFA